MLVKFEKIININKKKYDMDKINTIKMTNIKQKPQKKIYNKTKTLK